MSKQTRCFIALELPEEVIREIRKIQEFIKRENLFVGKFTEAKNIHLTLKFLGEINDLTIEKVKERLEKIEFPEFDAELGEVGVFSEKFIRIIWVELLGKVFEFQKKIDEVLKGLFEPEHRFMSHITIARVKSVKNKKELMECLKNIEVSKIKFRIKKFFLKSSELFPEGPIYKDIRSYFLISKDKHVK